MLSFIHPLMAKKIRTTTTKHPVRIVKSLKSTLFLFGSMFLASAVFGQTWIWYPGDFEISLANKVQNRRTERGTFFPVFWKMDNHHVLMDFHKVFDLQTEETVEISVEGEYNVKLDGKPYVGSPQRITVPAGRHRINIKVFNRAEVPSIYIRGRTILSDTSWLVTYEDREWIDETGKTSDVSATRWKKAGAWHFNTPTDKPSEFMLPVRPQSPVSVRKSPGSMLVDFGKETFGFLKLHGLGGKGNLTVYYGESELEALSDEHAETFDLLTITESTAQDRTMDLSKAFRFAHVKYDAGVSIDSVTMLYEYADVMDRGSFSCSDPEIDRIHDVAKYTFRLNTREFFIDGIKRDRWIWSGDAYQSYLMNYYSFFDAPTVTRTMLALRGKDPVTGHINTIMDYSLYWFLGIYDYYLYTGDKRFIEEHYDAMKTMMDFVLGRRNKDGLLEWMPGDWVFIDWAAGLSKKGEVSFEQLLFARSLETMALCADIANDPGGAHGYRDLADGLKKKLFEIYWNDEKQALVHSRVDGKQSDNVTRYANMFSIFFNYFTPAQQQAVRGSVLLNDNVQKITTPYMRFYELEALCALGEQAFVLKEMKNYWGGMLRLGATSFWEEYDPSRSGAEHYAMYGRKYGKSLCHAWGASPIYLLGKYYLGVRPLTPGYATYLIEPSLGGLQWMQGKVPTPAGDIAMHISTTQLKITAPAGKGVLRIRSKVRPTGKGIVPESKGADLYEIAINPGEEYIIKYKSVK